MRLFALVFVAVYVLNLVPAFAPPTWLVFSLIGFRSLTPHLAWLALVGAVAATLGRVTLAKMSRFMIRQRLMTQRTRENVDAIREGLEKRKKFTFGLFLFYAFTPLPSNVIFIAYGLTPMKMPLIAIPFLIGRSVSYSIWGLTSSAVGRVVLVDSGEALPYLSVYFILSQIVLLWLVYLFARIDWKTLFERKRLRLLPPSSSQNGMARVPENRPH